MQRLALILVLCVCCCSCHKAPPRKATYPVTGTVLVDGKPADDLAIRCLSATGLLDEKDPTVSAAFTDKDGKFQIATYQKADGVPAGSYVLTFEWGQRNLISAQYGGPDKLNGKYLSAKTSTVTFEVKEGEPKDLGTIQLTTK